MATILVVDDLAANRQVLVAILRAQGHRLIEAADGRDGLAAARAERPDLVITDVLMPGMDGFDFARQLRLDPATVGLPVVFYTAHYGEREARGLALSGGVADVLLKPVESAEVLRVVGRLLSGDGDVSRPSPALTSEPHREHLRLLTGNPVENAEDLRQANARLRALINIGLELASERDLDALLRRVCAAARDLFAASYVTLGILDVRDRTVQHFVTSGEDDASWITAGDTVSGMLGTIVTEQRALRGVNPDGDPATLQLPVRHPEIRAFLAAPVGSPAHVYGWICFVRNEGQPFTETDQDLIVALSGQVGRIYENCHFYAMARKRTHELEMELLQLHEAEAALRMRVRDVLDR